MSVNGLKPKFKNYEGYKKWRNEWKEIYKEHSKSIRKIKIEIKNAQRCANIELHGKLYKELFIKKSIARKMMMILDEAKLRMKRITEMKKELKKQNDTFPITFVNCRNVDFHFNKGHIEFPQLPMWTIKLKGKSYYVNHVDSNIPWSTRETPESSSTKGSIRFKNCNITLTKDGDAIIE